MNIKKKIWKVLGVSALVSLVAYAAIDFTIDQDPAAQGASSVMSSLLPGATSYLDISGNEDGNGDIMAETIALTQLTKDSQISSIDLNAKFASLMILHAKLRCQMLETGVWDDVEKDCDIDTGVEGSGDPRNDGWGASSCTQYETYKTCDEDLSGLGDCIWTDTSGDWRCEDPAAPVVVAQISSLSAFDTGDVAIAGNIEFASEGQALSEVLGRIRVELDAPADFCALHAGNVSIADEVAYSGVSSCGNDGVDYCDIDNFTGNFDSTETYLVACNTGGTYSNSIDVSDSLVLAQASIPYDTSNWEFFGHDAYGMGTSLATYISTYHPLDLTGNSIVFGSRGTALRSPYTFNTTEHNYFIYVSWTSSNSQCRAHLAPGQDTGMQALEIVPTGSSSSGLVPVSREDCQGIAENIFNTLQIAGDTFY